jgi:hypothetical protein
MKNIRLMRYFMIIICFALPYSNQCGMFGPSAVDKLVLAAGTFGADLKSAFENFDPHKMQAILESVQKSSFAVADSLAKAFHNTHHTMCHTTDAQTVLLLADGVFMAGSTSLGFVLIHKALTDAQQTNTRAATQLGAGVASIGAAVWAASLLTR